MFLAQVDSEQHTGIDDKCGALKVEKDKLLDVKIRIDEALEAYKELLDALRQNKG